MKQPSRKRRSAHTPAAKGGKWIYPPTRHAIYARDEHRCVYCGARGGVHVHYAGGPGPRTVLVQLTLDHVASVVGNGRQNDPANLVTCCLLCNSSKQGLGVRAWFKRLRSWGKDTNAVRRRIARQTARPIDRKLGALALLRRNMTFDEYQTWAAQTSSLRNEPDTDTRIVVKSGPEGDLPPWLHSMVRLDHGVSGIASEAGEIAEHLKHVRFHGKELDRDHMMKELGDLEWYIAETATALGIKRSEIIARNVKKLSARYPEGHFTIARSENRTPENE